MSRPVPAFRMIILLPAVFALFAGRVSAQPDDPLDRYNVVWDSPSANSSGSMPIGNGDVAANVWVEPNGDLVLLLSKTDAWSENCRLLKLGRVRIRVTPPLATPSEPFRQELRLRQGEILVTAGEGDGSRIARIWIDANRPVVHIELEGEKPMQVAVSLEVWRTAPRELTGKEVFSAYGAQGGPNPIVCGPDTVLENQGDRIVWFHRNNASIWKNNLEHQGLGGFAGQAADPLLNHTFGAMIVSDGLAGQSPTELVSKEPVKRCEISIVPLTEQTETEDAWLQSLETTADEALVVPLETARAEHRQWWNDFWNRSWIRIGQTETETDRPELKGSLIEPNDLPLRIGGDSQGQNRFRGDIQRAIVYGRALSAEEIAKHAAGNMPASGKDTPGAVADWSLADYADGRCVSTAPGAMVLQATGPMEQVAGRDGREKAALHFDGNNYLETPDCPALDLLKAVTLEAWARPETVNGRVIDKTTVATDNGYMIDTHPCNRLRLVLSDGALSAPDVPLEPGKWVHLVAVYDAVAGRKELYIDGRLVAKAETTPRNQKGSAFVVSRGYTLQRWITACAGRGAYPIKFNGTIFTVDMDGFDPDYRAWGGPYWWQNTRLPYWPLLAAGDFDLLPPLFRMYGSTLPLARYRTQVWFDHEGAFFPETMYFWGMYVNENYGWNRGNLPVSELTNHYIRREYTASPELMAMMLDYYDYAGDEAFLQKTLLPMADDLLLFWDKHYQRDEQGHLIMEPAQAIETLQNVRNPLTDIAGLCWVLNRLLALPEEKLSPRRQQAWSDLRKAIPPIPTEQTDQGPVLVGAEKVYGGRGNCENPELYAIFPFRVYGVGRPDLDVARRTFERRHNRGCHGWFQDDTQAAMLGLTDVAADYVRQRAANKHGGSRFPAFWGPNFDWIPDQDHGGNLMMALQSMLLQSDGEKIFLFPAWPADWDVSFKLHAPRQTVIEGVLRGGKLEQLTVTPAERRADVQIMLPEEKKE